MNARRLHVVAALAAVAVLAACGGSEDGGSTTEKAAGSSSATEAAASSSAGELTLEAKAAAANAEAAFDQKYEAGYDASSDAEGLAAQRQALADYDASLRAADLDPVATKRNALLTAIGAEIAVLDTMATGGDSDAAADDLLDAHDEVVDAKVALSKVTQ